MNVCGHQEELLGFKGDKDSKVTQPKWPYLIIKDKVGTLSVKGSRDITGNQNILAF